LSIWKVPLRESSLPKSPGKACDLAAALTPPEILAFLDVATSAWTPPDKPFLLWRERYPTEKFQRVLREKRSFLSDPMSHSRRHSPDRESSSAQGRTSLITRRRCPVGKINPSMPVAFPKIPSLVIGSDGRIPYRKKQQRSITRLRWRSSSASDAPRFGGKKPTH